MEYIEFKKELEKYEKEIKIDLKEDKKEKLYKYMNMLIEKNKEVNLTAIKEEKEIIEKHFIDSLSIHKYIEEKSKLIDIGTGAGFPGNIIGICLENKEIETTLVDAVNKKLEFINETVKELKIKNTKTIHGRVEEIGQKKEHRENYDIAVSRAVAALNVLVEYLVPLVKIGGKIICMKGPKIEEELKEAKKAIGILGGKIINIENIKIGENERNIIEIEKIKNSPKEYPRKAGTPTKNPIK